METRAVHRLGHDHRQAAGRLYSARDPGERRPPVAPEALACGKRGRNNELLDWPWPFGWLPNIRRDNYRFASLYGAIRRNDAPAAAGALPEFGHLVALFSGAYDRGSKVFGMIEERLGPEFIPFIRELVKKYSFRVLSAAEFQAAKK